MASSDPVAQAIDLLQQRRRQLLDEVKRVSEAIKALDPLGPVESGEAPDRNRPSVRTMAVSLMEEADRDWSVGDILSEYRDRGTPVHGKDPSNALRAALAEAKKRGVIVPTTTGRYRAAKWAKEVPTDNPFKVVQV